MQEKSLIKKNILQYIEIKGITKYNFYQKTGITRGVLDQNNGMSEENTARILAYFSEINPEWLLTGKGNMLRQLDLDTNSGKSIGDIDRSNVIGANVNGNGISINGASSELIEVIKKQQEQISNLIEVINKLSE